jgi:transposase-like protein
MARGQRNSTLERQWRERMELWQRSGLSVRQFCVRNGLTESTFYLWKRELRTRDQTSSKSPSTQPKFVPVSVVPSTTLSVEVRCPSGHVVCFPSCEVSALASLFVALDLGTREAQPC